MRKKLFLLFLAAFMASFVLAAKVVHVSEAQRVADEFFKGGMRTRGSDVSMKLCYDSNSMLHTRSDDGTAPSFYVFSAENGKGFVIVSGDDAVSPVLAYSFESPVPAFDDIPENLASWFRSIDATVRKLRSASSEAGPDVRQQWMSPAAAEGEFVMETAKWTQLVPFNMQCPKDGRFICVTGCTSTATAIILKYHKWPERGIGTTEAYTTLSKKIEVPARNLDHAYDWDNMLMYYGQGQYSDIEEDAVAALVADIGYAFKADYGAYGTGAWHDPEALYKHFSISPEVRDVASDYYSVDQWAEMLRVHLEDRGPVLYYAYDFDYGHAFVLDGYNDSGYFHVNWGWGGYCDGFYRLDNMAADNYNFNQNHIAVFDIVPNRGQSVEHHLRLSQPGMSADTDVFTPGVPFGVVAFPFNTSAVPFSGKLRLGVVGRDGVMKEWVSEELSYDGLLPRNYINFGRIPCVIVREPVIGDRIWMFYMADGTDEWKRMLPNGSMAAGEIFVADEFTIEESTSVRFSREIGVLEVGFKKGVAATVLVDGIPTVSGVAVEAKSISVDMSRIGAESFVIRLEKGDERKDISFTVKPLKS